MSGSSSSVLPRQSIRSPPSQDFPRQWVNAPTDMSLIATHTTSTAVVQWNMDPSLVGIVSSDLLVGSPSDPLASTLKYIAFIPENNKQI